MNDKDRRRQRIALRVTEEELKMLKDLQRATGLNRTGVIKLGVAQLAERLLKK